MTERQRQYDRDRTTGIVNRDKNWHDICTIRTAPDKTDATKYMKAYNAHVQATTVQQTANEVLGTPAKTLWFVVIETPNGKMQMNIGEKSYESFQRLLAPREEKTVVNVLPPTK